MEEGDRSESFIHFTVSPPLKYYRIKTAVVNNTHITMLINKHINNEGKETIVDCNAPVVLLKTSNTTWLSGG